MSDEKDDKDKEPDKDEPETETELDEEKVEPPKNETPPKRHTHRVKVPTTARKDDTDSLLPEIKIKEEIIADFTPMGWVLLGAVVVSVILYTWYKNRKEQGKGMLPDSVQAKMNQANRPHIAEQ
jgi:hypothetical protein